MAFVKGSIKIMMRLSYIFSIMAFFCLFSQAQGYQLSKQRPFQAGEQVELKATVGFIKAAEATLQVSDVIYSLNNKPTYKIDVYARTAGMFDLFSSVRDNWGSYFDTAQFVPHQFYRYISEGRFRKNEILYFDQKNNQVTVAKLDKETRKLKERKDHSIAAEMQDMVSGYYYLRAIDFDKIKVGEVITINTFFDDKEKPFSIKFMGRETIKTKLGNINALVLIPLMKKDSLFEEDNTLKVWLSDDLNKIPLKFQAKIFVGYLEVDVKNVKNLRHPLAIVE
ncbi:MAG: ATP-dependent exodnase (exonuclease V) alpha subunit - helicase superfamily I member [Cytophagales bacterium CG12_big_fil_rev_8_21_14_0_65_40_12]|nr:MAG: ATP-dependent exodnase (exonuclease V) alpha subunit - helicase superfamily I member [Cytophagales bacterium CG12_big_fil_rev_8_21_14_0_65_40_12]PIW03439.1 MAG: DUF3108 domain-containing protein [Cytophagales bacterium CG17_big_fil_post_rev_8_21_14_2_50_40_13]